MRIFIFGLILALLLQTTLLPLNLCLMLIFVRSLITVQKSTLYIGLIFGVLLGVLSNVNMGFYPMIILLSVKLIEIFKESPLYNNIIFFLPILFIIYLITSLLSSLILDLSFSFMQVIFETFISIPFYFLIKFWEERFIVHPQVKLKFKN